MAGKGGDQAFEDLRDERTYEEARAEERLWRQARRLGVSRRRFLQIVAAAGVTAAVGTPLRKVLAQQPTPAAPLVVKPTPPDLFYDFASNKEMRWENMYGRGYVVPNDLFFVRNHTRTPRVDAATWRLRIEGSGVQRPLDLSLDDLLGMPSVSMLRYVECAGNGRSFFETQYGRRASGTQWRLGAVGVAEWTGVPLRAVLDRAASPPPVTSCRRGSTTSRCAGRCRSPRPWRRTPSSSTRGHQHRGELHTLFDQADEGRGDQRLGHPCLERKAGRP